MSVPLTVSYEGCSESIESSKKVFFLLISYFIGMFSKSLKAELSKAYRELWWASRGAERIMKSLEWL